MDLPRWNHRAAFKVIFHVLVSGFVVSGIGGCSRWSSRKSARPCCIGKKLVVRRQAVGWHLFDVTVIEPIEQPFHVMRFARKLFGVPIRALNLRDGELADSMFFTNRDIAALSPEEVRWGPTRPNDLPVPPYIVTKPKTEGKTPGFFVTDAHGMRYLFKLDPPQAPELLSGAEVVTSKLLHALGYHVPSNEVVVLQPVDLHVASDVTVKSADGTTRPFTIEDLQRLISGRVRDGTLRVAGSRILDGEILGPARFKQFRDCAEIRALKVAYAWLNNIDAKDHNSLLVWNGNEMVGYLIDFGTSLGADAGGGGSKDACAGWRNIVDLKETSLKLFTLGFHQPVCDGEVRTMSPSIGLFSPYVDVERWKPYAPNVAFNAINEDDARWMAHRLARVSRAQIEAAVSAGRYSHAADAAYLAEVLDQRRQRIVDEYLDHDDLSRNPVGAQVQTVVQR